MMMPITSLNSYGSGAKMEASILNPEALVDLMPLLQARYVVPFHASMELAKRKPLYWVIWGAHIDTIEKARAAVEGDAFADEVRAVLAHSWLAHRF